MLLTRTEIIPTPSVIGDVKRALPVGSEISITCLPHHGIERTMSTAMMLAAEGYRAIPHLAARSIEDRAQLRSVVRDCESVGIDNVFVISGDAQQPAGKYDCSSALIDDITELSGGDLNVGTAGYPEGHPQQSAEQLLEAMQHKKENAAYIVTQMCFSAPAIINYVELLRREGVDLPVWAGVAGRVSHAKLVSLATKIGVGTSLKFLTRQGPLARRLLIGGHYASDSLVGALEEHPNLIEGVHIYSFNNFPEASRQEHPEPPQENLRTTL